jgi:hypothetical protein
MAEKLNMHVTIPKRGRGKPTPDKLAKHKAALQAFADQILEIDSNLDFTPSARGWCYMLEELAGLTKDRFDAAQSVIVECRKRGHLPLDITAKDGARAFENEEDVFDGSPEEYVDALLRGAHVALDDYHARSFWDDQPYFCQMVVEKIDLKELFKPICKPFCVRVANARGWSDLHLRADMMREFKVWESRGKVPVLLYCGDFDPAGVLISDVLLNNLREMENAVGWAPDNLVIDRFGLNLDFIEANGLSWINNLMTSSGKDLADPRHRDHDKRHVQTWLADIGARKVEANALVTRPDAGRQLCYEAITKYVHPDAPDQYVAEMEVGQGEARAVFDQKVEW